ncbi:MAG TPA: hypothetical protein VF006_22495 [Longimicrobium sp.]
MSTHPAGYSGTPLPGKLGIKPGHRLAFFHAPDGFAATLGALPEGVEMVHDDAGAVDLAVFFTARADALPVAFQRIGPRVHPAGTLWIAWPKKAAKVATDVTEDVVRAVGLREGMVDVKVCAIDAVWSGLKFVYRLADRPVAGRRGAA